MKFFLIYFNLTMIMFGICLVAHADKDKPELSADKISPVLLEGANAVIRYDKGYLDVNNEKRYSYHVKFAATVLNHQGRDIGQLKVFYDKFKSVGKLEGRIYDQSGNFVRKTKSHEVADYPINIGSSEYSDNRYKTLEIFYNEFPYTIEYEYTINVNGMINYPCWSFLNKEKVSVELSKFVIEVPPDFDIEYHIENIQTKPYITNIKGNKVYEWIVHDLKAFKWEKYSPGISDICPLLYIKPAVFKIEKYTGKTDSWKSIGKFFLEVNSGRDVLPPESQEEILELLSKDDGRIDKIKKLYKYLQNNTRYVSIQLGMGGWQCLNAEFVHKHKYGDCKALVNYMQSMLSIAGIHSYPVLIKAGSTPGDFIEEFPSNQFNHVILCVTLESDSLWLECTSQTIPFGYLGYLTMNRKGLLIASEGGKIVKTPDVFADDNMKLTNGIVYIDKSGNGNFKGSIVYTGYQYFKPNKVYMTYNRKETIDWFKECIDVSSTKINSLNFIDSGSDKPEITLIYDFDIFRLAASTSSRLFLCLNFIDRLAKIIAYNDREFPVFNNYPYTDISLINFVVPPGYIVESSPDFPVEIESDFGKYYANCKPSVNGDTLFYEMRFTKYKFYFPPENYKDLEEFYTNVSRTDHEQIVLKKEKHSP